MKFHCTRMLAVSLKRQVIFFTNCENWSPLEINRYGNLVYCMASVTTWFFWLIQIATKLVALRDVSGSYVRSINLQAWVEELNSGLSYRALARKVSLRLASEARNYRECCGKVTFLCPKNTELAPKAECWIFSMWSISQSPEHTKQLAKYSLEVCPFSFIDAALLSVTRVRRKFYYCPMCYTKPVVVGTIRQYKTCRPY